MKTSTPVVALLIDGDNAQLNSTKHILEFCERQGKLRIRKAYGDWQKPPLSSHVPALTNLGLDLVQQGRDGKNATDFRLTADVDRMLDKDEANIYVIASSDGHFTTACEWILQKGAEVIVIVNKSQTSGQFRNPRYRVVDVEDIANNRSKASVAPKAKPAAPPKAAKPSAAKAKAPAAPKPAAPPVPKAKGVATPKSAVPAAPKPKTVVPPKSATPPAAKAKAPDVPKPAAPAAPKPKATAPPKPATPPVPKAKASASATSKPAAPAAPKPKATAPPKSATPPAAKAKAPDAPKPATATTPKAEKQVIFEMLIQAHQRSSQPESDGWAHLGEIGKVLRELDSKFEARFAGKKLSAWYKTFPHQFEVEEHWVRLK